MKKLIFSFLLTLLCLPAHAAQSAFVEVAPNAFVRLISTGVIDADGTMYAGLEVRMPQTSKTYWRVPGETGIPMQVDWSQSQNISALDVEWPLPKRSMTGGYVDHVYSGDLIFPLRVQIHGEQAELVLNVTLGICDFICVPVFAQLELPLWASQKDIESAIKITQARARVPLLEPWDGELEGLKLSPDGLSVAFDLSAPKLHASEMILSAASPRVLIDAPVQQSDGTWNAEVIAGADVLALQDALFFHFESENGPAFWRVPLP